MIFKTNLPVCYSYVAVSLFGRCFCIHILQLLQRVVHFTYKFYLSLLRFTKDLRPLYLNNQISFSNSIGNRNKLEKRHEPVDTCLDDFQRNTKY